MKNARTMPKVMVRLEPEIKDHLEEVAQRNFRSLPNEIHMRLAASVEAEKEKSPNA
ncbi:Arc family DNA-binding protein [Paraburkholderia fungorum]|uniref:Arc family DNA-binding protein n=1 Tax=Paraburkholderia fungorum TaxID=134537 RepID=UPI0038B7E269